MPREPEKKKLRSSLRRDRGRPSRNTVNRSDVNDSDLNAAGKRSARRESLRDTAQEWSGSPAARYLILIAITVLVGISLIMAFSASSNDAVIRQVQREFAAQHAVSPYDSYEALSQEEALEAELDYQAGLEEAILEASAGNTAGTVDSGADAREGSGPFSIISTILSSAYAAGFRHLIFALVGAALAFWISKNDYRKLAPFAIPVAAILLAALIFLLIAGQPVLGSARWINLGFFSLQPSEFAKPILVLLVAYYCSWAKDRDAQGPERKRQQESLPLYARDSVMPALLVAGCIAAIVLSPDIGTALIIGVGIFAAYLLSGWSWVPAVAAVGGLAAILFGRILLGDGGYQQRRIFEFITRWTEGSASHQTWQAELALGSGGILGLGPGLSRQKFRYLPEAHNDFIIAILGEELGLIGVGLVLLAFVLILWGGFQIAARANDRLGLAIAGGATTLIVFQALLNIFAVISLGPVTGKPLPFVTLGGSSMISTFMLVGLIFSVARFGRAPVPKTNPSAFGSLIPAKPQQLQRRVKSQGFDADQDHNHNSESDFDEILDASDSSETASIKSNAYGESRDAAVGRKRDKSNDKDNGRGKKRRSHRKSRLARNRSQDASDRQPRGEDMSDDEDDFDWRWDSGSHLSGPSSRR